MNQSLEFAMPLIWTEIGTPQKLLSLCVTEQHGKHLKLRWRVRTYDGCQGLFAA